MLSGYFISCRDQANWRIVFVFVEMRLSPEDCELIAAIARSSNFSEAAIHLGIKPSTLHTRFGRLELEVGQKLVHRPGPFRFTPAGKLMADYAKVVMSESASLNAGLRSLLDPPDAITVMTNPSVVIDDLPDVFNLLKMMRPNLLIHALDGTISQTMLALLSDKIDAGIVYNAHPTEGIRLFPYRYDRLHIIAPLSHPLARFKEVSFAQAVEYAFIGTGEAHNLSRLLQAEAKKHHLPVRFSMHVSNYEVQAHMVGATDLGIALALGNVARRFQTFRPIKAIPLSGDWTAGIYQLCVRDVGTLSAATTDLMTLLMQRYKIPT